MSKMQEHIVEGKRISVGLEDSKKTWKLCVRCEQMIVHETGMPARYEVLRTYLLNRYLKCDITVMYEAGFHGFWLHDLLTADGITCVVTPPNKVSCPKNERVKTDKRDARLLAKNLENRDYVACAVPDREQREDRQISRTLNQVQKDIVVEKNRVRRFLDFHGLYAGLPEGEWSDQDYRNLSGMTLSHPMRVSLDAYLEIIEKLISLRNKLMAELKALCKRSGTGLR
jgi:transposase